MNYKLQLSIYPLLQGLFMVLSFNSVVRGKIGYTLIFIFITSIMMAYALHISYHHHVHHRPKNQTLARIMDIIISILIGSPFHNYQIQHWIHHKYDNGLKDLTTTYALKNGKKVAKPFFKYIFLWFLNLKPRNQFKSIAEKEGFYNESIDKKIKFERLVNLLFFVMLLVINYRFALLFIIMIYAGWSFISLINYGQHLPETVKEHKGYSYYKKWYNQLFINNGLHYEHHKKPSLIYWDLEKKEQEAGKNIWPQIIDGVRFIFKKNHSSRVE